MKKINSQTVLYSRGSNDECFTPIEGVKPILKYIPKDWIVWCPFDTEDPHPYPRDSSLCLL